MIRCASALVALCLASPAVAADEEQGNSGSWTYKAEIKPDGGGFATALSPSPQVADYNEPAYIVARCLSGRTEFMVGTQGGWAVSGQKIEVTSQVGDGQPVTAKWDVSTNGKAVFVDDRVEEFLKAIADPGKIRIAVKDNLGQVHENVFDTGGFGLVREKIAKACKWPQ